MMLDEVDPRIAEFVRKRSAVKLNKVLELAQELIDETGKSKERALADALKILRLV